MVALQKPKLLFQVTLIIFLIFNYSAAFAQKTILESLITEAEHLILKKELEEALRKAHRIVQQFPTNPDSYLLRAKVFEGLSQPSSALTDLGLAVALDPANAESRFMRGMLAYRLNRTDLARNDFRYLLSIKESITNTVFFRQNNFQGTDKIMTIQSGPVDQLLHLIGLVEIKAGNYKKAVEVLDSAIQLNSKEADLYVHRGLALEKLGKDSLTAISYQKAFQLDPNHPIALANQSKMKNKNWLPAESEEWITKAIMANPASPDFYAERALQRFENKDYLRALQDYDSATRLDPNDAELWFNRGLALEKTGESVKAFESFGKSILLNERHAKAWFMQGALQLKQKNFSSAIESFTIAIGIDPNYAIAFQNRAIAYFKKGDQLRACDDFTSAQRLGSNSEESLLKKYCR